MISTFIADTFDEDGVSYAIGEDARLRTSIARRGNHKVLSQTPNKPLIEQAKAARKPVSAVTTSIDGQEAYVSLAPADFIGRTWYVVADVSKNAIDAESRELALRNGLIAAALIGLLSIGAIFIARGITMPVNRMRDAVGRLASGESGEIPGRSAGTSSATSPARCGRCMRRVWPRSS